MSSLGSKRAAKRKDSSSNNNSVEWYTAADRWSIRYAVLKNHAVITDSDGL